MAHTVWPPNGSLSKYLLGQFEPGYVGYGVDVGASDGISISTTYMLEVMDRWTILSVEPNPDFAADLKRRRAFVETCACSDKGGTATLSIHVENPESFTSLRPTTENLPEAMTWKFVEVAVCTVDELIRKWEFPRLDPLCVDTEGTELDVLRGADLSHWNPKVVVVESWTKPNPTLDGYLGGFGYRQIATSVDNLIYRRDE